MKLKQELIAQLSKGEIQIEYDGKSLELLRKILEEAFPKDTYVTTGRNKFYFPWYNNHEEWTCSDFPESNKQIIEIKDFLVKEEKFPTDDFGVIVENDNGKEILDYLVSKGFDKNGHIGDASNYSYYYILNNTNIIRCNYCNPISKKFTLQQLKELDMKQIDYTIKGTKLPNIPVGTEYRVSTWTNDIDNDLTIRLKNNFISFGVKTYKNELYILAESIYYTNKFFYMFKLTDLQKLTNNNMGNKEIIGYKLIKPEYKQFFYDFTKTCNIDRIKDSFNKIAWVTQAIQKCKEAGVLDIWFEPVYESKEQIVSMNGKFNLTIKDKKVFHKTEDITNFVEGIGVWWKNVMAEGNLKFGNKYDFLISSNDVKIMKTGCVSQETYLSDWLKVYDLIK